MDSWPDLYSTNPLKRITAANEFLRQYPDFHVEWPFGNWGSANAYIVLLGPSPGKDHTGEKNVGKVSLGEYAVAIKFNDGDGAGRNQNWRNLNLACFGSYGTSDICDRLSALHNLASANSSSERDVENQLADGCPSEWSRLIQVQPVIVAPLSKITFQAICKYAQTKGFDFNFEQPPIFEGYGKCLEAFSVKMSPNAFTTLFVKPPQHPSRPLPKIKTRNLKAPDDEVRTQPIKIAVDWFLKREGYLKF